MKNIFVIKALNTVTNEVLYIKEVGIIKSEDKVLCEFELNERTEYAKMFKTKEDAQYVYDILIKRSSVYSFEILIW